MTNTMGRKIRMALLVTLAAGTALAGTAAFAFTGTAEAHTGGAWVGTHYTRTAKCEPAVGAGFSYKTFNVQPPVMYATKNDSKTYQAVAWRPELVEFSNGLERVVKQGNWEIANAYDTQPAQFKSQPLFLTGSMTATYVRLTLAFATTTTPVWADSTFHYAQVEKTLYNSFGNAPLVTTGWSC